MNLVNSPSSTPLKVFFIKTLAKHRKELDSLIGSYQKGANNLFLLTHLRYRQPKVWDRVMSVHREFLGHTTCARLDNVPKDTPDEFHEAI